MFNAICQFVFLIGLIVQFGCDGSSPGGRYNSWNAVKSDLNENVRTEIESIIHDPIWDPGVHPSTWCEFLATETEVDYQNNRRRILAWWEMERKKWLQTHGQKIAEEKDIYFRNSMQKQEETHRRRMKLHPECMKSIGNRKVDW